MPSSRGKGGLMSIRRTGLSDEEFDELYRLLFETMLQGVVHQDADGKIISMNPAAERILGKSPSDFLGQTSVSVEHDSIREDGSLYPGLQHPSMVALRTGEAIRDSVMGIYNPREKAYRWISISAVPLFNKGSKTPYQVYTIFEDITERKEREADLKRYSDELARSNAELKSFAYAASHDLREPLRTISGFLQILKQDYGAKLDDKARDYINRTVDASKRLHDMIDDLLSFSRLETRKKTFAKVDLNNVLAESVRDLEAAISEHGAKVSAESLPVVLADDQQMSILFRNLIDNAIKFRGKEPPSVKVHARRDGDEWLVSFKDNGIGIDPADRAKIFNMFSRLHSWKEYPGNGIGLAMCKKIVERHGGRIWVESEIGKGSTFLFTLPDRPSSQR
jgi:PAS domain S-box-containing protein